MDVKIIKTARSLQFNTENAPDLLKEETLKPKYSFMPKGEERYLAAVTATGHRVQQNYRSYSVAQLKNALDHGDYTVVGRTFRGSRTRLTKKEKDNHHSEYMTPLVESIDLLEEKQKQLVTPENVEQLVEELMDIYNSIFEHAFRYCEKQNPFFPEGKARKDMVKLIRDQANEERLKLGNNARALADRVRDNPDERLTFSDAVGMIRTKNIRAGENGIREITSGGRGTSDIIVAEKDDGGRLYIRPSESIKADSATCKSYFDDEMEKVEQESGEYRILQVFSQNLSRLPKAGESEMDRVIRALSFLKPADFDDEYEEQVMKNNALFPYTDEIRNMIDEMKEEPVYQEFKNRRDKLNTAWRRAKNETLRRGIQGRSEEEKKILAEMNALGEEFNKKESSVSRLLRVLRPIGRLLNQRNFAREGAMVKEGTNISDRNVAVSIMARTLGLRSIVAESEIAEVEVNGKRIRGIIMEEAKGENLRMVLKRNKEEGRRTRYAPEAMKQLSNLQIFDLLCGQVDRKPDNYVVTVERQADDSDMVTGIKAIDNDMSCGMVDYMEDVVTGLTVKSRRMVKGFLQELPAMTDDDGRLILEAVDKDLRDRLLALSPRFIDFQLTGILSAEERDAMKKRLTAIQKIFQKRDALERKTGSPTVYMQSGQDWERFRNRFEQKGTDMHTYYLRDLMQSKKDQT